MASSAFSLILVMLALGVVLSRTRVLPENAADTLNQVVLNVCLPATVLRYAPRLTLSASVLHVAMVPWVLLALMVPLVNLVARALRLREDERGVLLLCTTLGNTSYLGYPLVVALLGEAALPHAVIYDQFGVFLILSSFGLFVVSRFGGEKRPTATQVLMRILRFAPFWALVVGLTIMPASPPPAIAEVLQRASDAMLPLAMLAIGATIRFRLPTDELRALGASLFLKLVLAPCMALVLLRAFGIHGLEASAAVLESAMPPMITAGALAMAHGMAPRLAAALVGYGIPVSLVVVPAWAWVLARLV
jgi:predicted permease